MPCQDDSPDGVRVGGVKHAAAAAVELEDQAVLGVYADAVAGEAFSVVGQGDPLAQLRAQAAPGFDHLLFVALGRPEPVVERREDPLSHRDPLAFRSTDQVQAGSGRLKVVGERLLRLVAIDADPDDAGFSRTVLFGLGEDARDFPAVEHDVVRPFDGGMVASDLSDCLGHGHGAGQ